MAGAKPEYLTVVGIVADVRSHSIDRDPAAQMCLTFNDAPTDFAGIVARGAGEPRALLAAFRAAIHQAAPAP